MIKQLQRKFIAITMASLLLVMAVVLGSINIANVYHMNQRADGILNVLAENGGKFPDKQLRQTSKPDGIPEADKAAPPAMNPEAEAPGETREMPQQHRGKPGGGFQISGETPFETRYFIVRTDLGEAITQVDTGHVATVTDADARQYAKDVLKGGRQQGYEDTFRYLVTADDDSLLLIFVDCRMQIETAAAYLRNSCAIAAACLAVVLILVSVLSKRAIRPVIENMEKQKRFITDAGHEIKTPLAIISANNDVIEMTTGKSEWTASIHNQVDRLSELVKNLLTLAKMDEGQVNRTFAPLDYSTLVTENAWTFAPLAEKKGALLEVRVQPGISVHGDEGGLSHLVTVLADNAVKYCDENGRILISLTKKGREARLEVTNTCRQLPEGDLARLFDRFYRTDESRSRESGGYGIGLSVAQAIVKAHSGRISATAKGEDAICFAVELTAI